MRIMKKMRVKKSFIMEGKILKIAKVLFPKKYYERKATQRKEGGVYLRYIEGKVYVGGTEDAYIIIKSNYSLTLTTGIISGIEKSIAMENFNIEDVIKICKDHIIINNLNGLSGYFKIFRKINDEEDI